MAQYMATKTKNLLERQENSFHYGGRDYPGLLDVEDDILYDHPEDSCCKALGMKTDLDRGIIFPVHAERVTKKLKVVFKKPKWFDVPSTPSYTMEAC